MKILITQPTFIPWLGFFDLIDQADEIVFLDDVQFSKRSWQQRNQIRTKNGLEWITIPSQVKGLRDQHLKNTKINIGEFKYEKFKNKIILNYSKAKYFNDFIQDFFIVFEKGLQSENIMSLNLTIIKWFIKIFKIDKKINFSSGLNVEGNKTDKIINICKKFNTKKYISTLGAKEYLKNDIDNLKKNHIEVLLHNYKHPEYNQCFEPFISYACSLDLLLNEGKNSSSIIKSGRLKLKNL